MDILGARENLEGAIEEAKNIARTDYSGQPDCMGDLFFGMPGTLKRWIRYVVIVGGLFLAYKGCEVENSGDGLGYKTPKTGEISQNTGGEVFSALM